jgi:hypothetical protein
MVAVVGGGFGNEAHALLAVLADVLFGARPDEVDLEVGRVVVAVLAAVGEVPVVDVVGAEVLEGAQAGGDRGEVVGRAGERRALEDQQCGLAVDGSAEGGPAARLV